MLVEYVYLEALDDESILVVKPRSNFLAFNCANVLFYVAPDNHDLPLASILGNSTISGATMTASLQKHAFVLALHQQAVLVFDSIELGE
jgi:hypothetical protein